MAVCMCVCMCVTGLRVDKEETGLGWKRKRDECRIETDGILTTEQLVAARPQAGSEQRWKLAGGEEDTGKSRVRVLPRFLSFLDSYILTAM